MQNPGPVPFSGANAGLDIPPWLRAVAAYYLGVPVLTALFLGLNHSGSAHHFATGASIVYWLGITLPFWLLLEGTSRVAQKLFQMLPVRIPGVAATLAGSLVSMALIGLYITSYTPFMVGLFSPNANIPTPSTLLTAELGFGMLLKFSVVPLYWIGTTYLFERIFGYPNYYGLAPASRIGVTNPQSSSDETFDRDTKFGKLLPSRLGTDILSIHAEDHYVKVHTAQGAALVRYRFADAVRDVKGLKGIQVHRSHWVRLKSVDRSAGLEPGNRALRLIGGRTVPVSQSYLGVLRMLDIA